MKLILKTPYSDTTDNNRKYERGADVSNLDESEKEFLLNGKHVEIVYSEKELEDIAAKEQAAKDAEAEKEEQKQQALKEKADAKAAKDAEAAAKKQ